MALPNDRDCAYSVPLRIDAARQDKTVKLLLEYGCHVNATDEEGLTPLDLALYYESVRLVNLLIRADGEKGKDKEEMRKRIKYLECRVGRVIMDNKRLKHRVHSLEGHLEKLEYQAANMDARLDNLEDQQQKHLSFPNPCSAMINVHSSTCIVYVVSAYYYDTCTYNVVFVYMSVYY